MEWTAALELGGSWVGSRTQRWKHFFACMLCVQLSFFLQMCGADSCRSFQSTERSECQTNNTLVAGKKTVDATKKMTQL